MVKNLPAVQGTRVQSLGWKDPLETGIATHSSIPAWRIPWTEGPGGLQSVWPQRDGHDWATHTATPKLIVFSRSLSFENWVYLLLFSCSVVSDSETPWTAAHQASLSSTISWSLLKPMSIESVMPSSHLILCRLLLFLSSIFPSIRVFSNESALCIRWPKYWSFSFNISPSNEHPGLISYRMDWLDLLAVPGTLKSFLQHHSSKASILWHSTFFIFQLSHSHVITEKP